MTFEEFAKLFIRRGKTSVVQYSRYTLVRDSAPQNIEELTKSKFETSLSSTKSSERSIGAPVTAEYNTDFITAEKVLTALIQVYLPEQLLLDQELEDLRIECISTLATTKTSLMALFRDCILRGSQETSLATPKHLHDFVNAVFPDVVSESELESLLFYYMSHDLTSDKLAFGVFVERMLRPVSADFSGMLDLNLASYTASEYLPAPRSAEVALATLLLKLTLNMHRNKRIRETLKALTKGQIEVALRHIKGPVR